jgi:diacylglycerol O-acyltransferase / wax synthase
MGQRLTDSDASFLYMESASGPMHISSVYVLEGELDYQRVFDHFAERIHLVPSYRRRLAQVPLNLAHPTWVDDPDFDLANHVLHHALPSGTSLQEGIDAAVTLNEPMLDRSRPLWRFTVISGVPGKTLILQQTHHAMIDGVSGIELTTILYDFDAKGGNRPPPAPPWHPDPVPGPLERVVRRPARQPRQGAAEQPAEPALGRRAPVAGWLGRAMRVMSQFVTRPAITAPFNAALVGPHAPGTVSEEVLRRDPRDPPRPGRHHQRRGAGGGERGRGALSGASRRETESQYLRIMCPVSVRTEDQAGALGNQVSAIFPVLPAWPMNAAASQCRVHRDRSDQARRGGPGAGAVDPDGVAAVAGGAGADPAGRHAVGPHRAGGPHAHADSAELRLAAAQSSASTSPAPTCPVCRCRNICAVTR